MANAPAGKSDANEAARKPRVPKMLHPPEKACELALHQKPNGLRNRSMTNRTAAPDVDPHVEDDPVNLPSPTSQKASTNLEPPPQNPALVGHVLSAPNVQRVPNVLSAEIATRNEPLLGVHEDLGPTPMLLDPRAESRSMPLPIFHPAATDSTTNRLEPIRSPALGLEFKIPSKRKFSIVNRMETILILDSLSPRMPRLRNRRRRKANRYPPKVGRDVAVDVAPVAQNTRNPTHRSAPTIVLLAETMMGMNLKWSPEIARSPLGWTRSERSWPTT